MNKKEIKWNEIIECWVSHVSRTELTVERMDSSRNRVVFSLEMKHALLSSNFQFLSFQRNWRIERTFLPPTHLIPASFCGENADEFRPDLQLFAWALRLNLPIRLPFPMRTIKRRPASEMVRHRLPSALKFTSAFRLPEFRNPPLFLFSSPLDVPEQINSDYPTFHQ